MKDFWISSGHHLLDRDGGGGLVLTDDFLKLYLARPELIPPQDACDAERALDERTARSGYREPSCSNQGHGRARELAALSGVPRSSPPSKDARGGLFRP